MWKEISAVVVGDPEAIRVTLSEKDLGIQMRYAESLTLVMLLLGSKLALSAFVGFGMLHILLKRNVL